MTKTENNNTARQIALPGLGLELCEGGKGLLTGEASCQRLESTFQLLVAMEDASGWFLGDVLLEAAERLANKDTPTSERERYRAMESQIKRLTRKGKKFAEARVVCQRIPPEKRRSGLVFEIHAAVLLELQSYGRSTDEEIELWLTQAEEEGYQLSELRLAMRAAFEVPGAEQTTPFVSVSSVMRPFRQFVKEIVINELSPEQADRIRGELSGVEDFLRQLSAIK